MADARQVESMRASWALSELEGAIATSLEAEWERICQERGGELYNCLVELWPELDEPQREQLRRAWGGSDSDLEQDFSRAWQDSEPDRRLVLEVVEGLWERVQRWERAERRERVETAADYACELLELVRHPEEPERQDLRRALVMTEFAAFERHLIQFLNRIRPQEAGAFQTEARKLKGSLVVKARSYLSRTVGLPGLSKKGAAQIDPDLWATAERVERLFTIRNCLAHDGGALDDERRRTIPFQEFPGIAVVKPTSWFEPSRETEWLTFTPEFIRQLENELDALLAGWKKLHCANKGHIWSSWTVGHRSPLEYRSCALCRSQEERESSEEHGCATQGHAWGSWQPLFGGESERRECSACHADQQRPSLSAAQCMELGHDWRARISSMRPPDWVCRRCRAWTETPPAE